MRLCQSALDAGLPVMTVDTGSYETATNLNRMNREIPVDDSERVEKVTNFVARHLDHEWLRERCGSPRELTLSPPAFRYRMVQRAREANKRIVLPEGSEPRTVQAAAICHERGIARCVLLAKREAVESVARTQGITLPEGLEILDPDSTREQYVEPMVELRRNKGLNAPMARAQLEDTVVLGTMMLALDEVDGLVSGAINTTANTIRPALQLIKTAPEYNLVSSIFFMLLPEQVLVYGDCAVNPDPDAEQLAEIARQSAASAKAFGITPRVAMLSYSTGDSGTGNDVEKVREATRLAREANPDLLLDGPLQYDAAAIDTLAAVFDLSDFERDHLQGSAAQRQLHQRGPHAAGPAQTGERPVPRRPGGRHRLHHRPHRHSGGGPVTQQHGVGWISLRRNPPFSGW